MYVVVSYRLFLNTNTLKDAVVRAPPRRRRRPPWRAAGAPRPSVQRIVAWRARANRLHDPPPPPPQIPHEDNRLLLRNCLMIGAAMGAALAWGFLLVHAQHLA